MLTITHKHYYDYFLIYILYELALTFFLFVEFEDQSNIDVIVDVFKNIYLHFAQRGKLSLSWPCYGGVF